VGFRSFSEVVQTSNGPAGAARAKPQTPLDHETVARLLLYCRNQQSDQNGDDRDDDEEFSSRETAECVVGLIRDVFHCFLHDLRSLLMHFPHRCRIPGESQQQLDLEMGVAENAIGFSPFALSVPIAELADRIEYDHTVHALVAIPYEKNRRSQEHGRIPRRSPGARPHHFEQAARVDSVRCAARGHRRHQLRDAGVQVQRKSRGVRRVFEPLQFVPDESRRDGCVQEGTQGFRYDKRHHPFPHGQAAAGRSREKAGEGADRGERPQEIEMNSGGAGAEARRRFDKCAVGYVIRALRDRDA